VTATAWIARERHLKVRVPPWYGSGAVLLPVAVFALLAWLAGRAGPPIAAEDATLDEGPVLLRALYTALGTAGARVLSAAAAAATIAATALLGLRFWHSPAVGLLAGALVAVDPSLLAYGHTATPVTLVLALGLLALVAFTSPRAWPRWIGAALLFLGAFIGPSLLLWSVPLLPFVLLRGHIYAAPKHLGLAVLQTLAAPALGVLLAVLVAQGPPPGLPACLRTSGVEGLLLATVPGLGAGRFAVPDPALWFGGLLTLAFLGGAAILHVVGRFRIQRLPGRLQLRLPQPLSRLQARSLWLLAFALFAPMPVFWLPLLALGIGAGIRALGEDARGFGGLIAVLVLGFALVYAVRLWGLVTGTATPEEAGRLLSIVPWMGVQGC